MVQTAVRLLSTVTMLSMMLQHANSQRGTVISLCIHVCTVELCLNNFSSTVGYLLLNSCNAVKLCLSGCLFDQRVSHVDRCQYFRQQIIRRYWFGVFFTFSRLKFLHSITQLGLKLSSLEMKQRGSDGIRIQRIHGSTTLTEFPIKLQLGLLKQCLSYNTLKEN